MKPTKLPYDYVSKKVDELYEKQFSPNDLASIEKHCEFIASFINACGWTEEEYIRAMFGFAPLDNQSN